MPTKVQSRENFADAAEYKMIAFLYSHRPTAMDPQLVVQYQNDHIVRINSYASKIRISMVGKFSIVCTLPLRITQSLVDVLMVKLYYNSHFSHFIYNYMDELLFPSQNERTRDAMLYSCHFSFSFRMKKKKLVNINLDYEIFSLGLHNRWLWLWYLWCGIILGGRVVSISGSCTLYCYATVKLIKLLPNSIYI
jgi:hypothetical protein